MFHYLDCTAKYAWATVPQVTGCRLVDWYRDQASLLYMIICCTPDKSNQQSRSIC